MDKHLQSIIIFLNRDTTNVNETNDFALNVGRFGRDTLDKLRMLMKLIEKH